MFVHLSGVARINSPPKAGRFFPVPERVVAVESRCGAAASLQEPNDMLKEVRNGLLTAAAFRAHQQELRQRSRGVHQRTDQNPAPCKRSGYLQLLPLHGRDDACRMCGKRTYRTPFKGKCVLLRSQEECSMTCRQSTYRLATEPFRSFRPGQRRHRRERRIGLGIATSSARREVPFTSGDETRRRTPEPPRSSLRPEAIARPSSAM
jgi:hypothetical protein